MRKALLLLAAAVASPAVAAPFPKPPEASIPFANHRNAIRTFDAPNDRLVYLQDRQRRWYGADVGFCRGLKWAERLGYDTRGGLSLDAFGAIFVDGQRCPIVSLTRSEGPPRKLKRKAAQRVIARSEAPRQFRFRRSSRWIASLRPQ